MKIAQEVRAGNVIMVNGSPMIVLKAEYNKSGRNAAVVKMRGGPYNDTCTGDHFPRGTIGGSTTAAAERGGPS